MVQRTTLEAREHRAVDLLGVGLAAQDRPARPAAQRLVGGEGHDVGDPDRIRVRAAGDQPGRVGGVEHEEGADGVGDLAEGQRIDDPGVGGRTGHDEAGSFGLRLIGQPVEVDDLARIVVVVAGRRHAVRDEAPDLRVIEAGDPWVRCPPWSRRMASTVSPGLEQRLVGGQVGVGPA